MDSINELLPDPGDDVPVFIYRVHAKEGPLDDRCICASQFLLCMDAKIANFWSSRVWLVLLVASYYDNMGNYYSYVFIVVWVPAPLLWRGWHPDYYVVGLCFTLLQKNIGS